MPQTGYPPTPPTISCYRHPGATAPVACRRCDRPICTSCMVSAPVGWQCPACVRDAPPVMRLDEVSSLRRPVVSIAIVAVCVAAALPSLAAGGLFGGNVFTTDLALRAAPVADGEWWRIFTSAFLHSGVIHLGFNMLILYKLGEMLEPALGRIRFAALYAASLTGGALGVLLLGGAGYTLGASGAVFGLMGAAVVLPRDRYNPFAAGLGGLLLMNLLLTFAIPGISVGGHLGGLVVGLVAGALLRLLGSSRAGAWAGTALCAAAAVGLFVACLPVAQAAAAP